MTTTIEVTLVIPSSGSSEGKERNLRLVEQEPATLTLEDLLVLTEVAASEAAEKSPRKQSGRRAPSNAIDFSSYDIYSHNINSSSSNVPPSPNKSFPYTLLSLSSYSGSSRKTPAAKAATLDRTRVTLEGALKRSGSSGGGSSSSSSSTPSPKKTSRCIRLLLRPTTTGASAPPPPPTSTPTRSTPRSGGAAGGGGPARPRPPTTRPGGQQKTQQTSPGQRQRDSAPPRDVAPPAAALVVARNTPRGIRNSNNNNNNNTQNVAALDDDLDDAYQMSTEYQRRAYEVIRQRNIDDNLINAQEMIPESFSRVSMLYVPARVNNHELLCFVDSGAQMTIMDEKTAQACELDRLIDRRFRGMAIGAGATAIVGRIHLATVSLGGVVLPLSIAVLAGAGVSEGGGPEAVAAAQIAAANNNRHSGTSHAPQQGRPQSRHGLHNIRFILGLDQLRRHCMCIDLSKPGRGVLRFGGAESEGERAVEVPFLGEHELPPDLRGGR